MHDADGEAEVLAVAAAVEARVVQAQVAVADALDADVGVLGAELARRVSAASASWREGQRR